MRKYYQAALAVTAVISVISLLFYRHEYNKLRYVLEVFNYFGKPEAKGANINCTNFDGTFITVNTRFDTPIPSWQRVEDDLYIYSAYNINNKEVRAIGIGTVNSVLHIQCLIFFENENKPLLGNFKYIAISSTVVSDKENLRYGGYQFVCSYVSDKNPTGITFITKSNKYLNYAPIFPIKTQSQSSNDNRIAICVMQSPIKPMQSIELISFIAFHALIGIDHFIVYDSGIPNEFNNRLRDMTDYAASFTYDVVPWNFPFMGIEQNVMREIIEMDCLYRTYNSVTYAITLSWNEYIVLKYHHAVINLLTDFAKGTKLVADRYKLRTVVFCTQQNDNKQYANSTLMVLKKTKSDLHAFEDHPIYIYKPHVILRNLHMYTKEIQKSLVAVNQYKYCDESIKDKETEDPTILRFAQDMQSSSIVKNYFGFYDTSKT